MTTRETAIDRAALVRRSLLELVAEKGFRGTNMAAVAERAGVAAGTIYVHYGSKDDLIAATYREVKRDLGVAATAGVHASDPPERRFRTLWLAAYHHLVGDPVRARFLLQVETSPVAASLSNHHSDPDDPLLLAAGAPDMAGALLDLPVEVLYDLGLAPAVRLAASSARSPLSADQLELVAGACWRAVTSG